MLVKRLILAAISIGVGFGLTVLITMLIGTTPAEYGTDRPWNLAGQIHGHQYPAEVGANFHLPRGLIFRPLISGRGFFCFTTGR